MIEFKCKKGALLRNEAELPIRSHVDDVYGNFKNQR